MIYLLDWHIDNETTNINSIFVPWFLIMRAQNHIWYSPSESKVYGTPKLAKNACVHLVLGWKLQASLYIHSLASTILGRPQSLCDGWHPHTTEWQAGEEGAEHRTRNGPCHFSCRLFPADVICSCSRKITNGQVEQALHN